MLGTWEGHPGLVGNPESYHRDSSSLWQVPLCHLMVLQRQGELSVSTVSWRQSHNIANTVLFLLQRVCLSKIANIDTSHLSITYNSNKPHSHPWSYASVVTSSSESRFDSHGTAFLTYWWSYRFGIHIIFMQICILLQKSYK